MAVGFMLTAMTMLTALTAQAAEYGIKFDGQSVTDANKNDLTASITSIMSGTATYNSETKTLSLTDVMIDGSSGPVLQIDQDELTIEVTGDCQLMTMNGVGLVINDSHVTLTGRGTLSISGEDGVYLANMVEYIADLSEFEGQTLKIRLIDNATDGWGFLFADSFITYYAEGASLPAAFEAK